MLTVTRDGGKYTAVRTLPLTGGGELRMTYDATPMAGTVVLDLGHGLTVVEREAPGRPGTAWVAPFAACCTGHGHIVSRRTVEQARDEARAHIAAEHRAQAGQRGAADVLGLHAGTAAGAGGVRTRRA